MDADTGANQYQTATAADKQQHFEPVNASILNWVQECKMCKANGSENMCKQSELVNTKNNFGTEGGGGGGERPSFRRIAEYWESASGSTRAPEKLKLSQGQLLEPAIKAHAWLLLTSLASILCIGKIDFLSTSVTFTKHRSLQHFLYHKKANKIPKLFEVFSFKKNFVILRNWAKRSPNGILHCNFWQLIIKSPLRARFHLSDTKYRCLLTTWVINWAFTHTIDYA